MTEAFIFGSLIGLALCGVVFWVDHLDEIRHREFMKKLTELDERSRK